MTLKDQKQKLAELIRNYHEKGWSPATSTNYSFKDLDENIWVSRSGVDKSEFSENDFITVNLEGIPTGEFEQVKPSAETLIHCVLYMLFSETRVILHSHSLYPVILSFKSKNSIEFSGYELQKGFAGCSSHSGSIEIPVFDNSQDMNEFSKWLKDRQEELKNHCFLIRGHGTYAWGKDLSEAKRHLETLEYLCHCEYLK
ncbi:MAG: methylthioribulose 1-phosphate dehydratase [Cryomorphaceae bacterium]|jgi:methylthioribulose-1-phosphate dehydratase|nr:methylthioribulose 1-phosphate dehydratase [Cryomorphaceae bacterium]